MKTIHKVLLGIFALLALFVGVLALFGSEGKNDEFKPQNEFKLDPWIELKIGPLDMSVNKAVLYLFLAAALTIFAMTYIARRMQDKPNRVQTAVEAAYVLMRDNITKGNMDSKMASRWFAFVATLFLFIWFSNMIGYLPLPTNTHEKVDVFGFGIPAFALYAATANISVPLVLTLFVWVAYHVEGVRAQGFFPYFRSWIPAGTPGGPMKGLIFIIEVISQFVRIISLSVRLFANILAGHLLILFMAGGLVVLLGLAAIGVLTLPLAIAFYIFEVGLVATLQAFIFATLTSIYFGGATARH
ncbi:MAG TPA: F0F1 ATP synthase subunit A [Solirubrobacteraceae bacterium]|nr:F0F1 ATP synthase subunit A [Solirubrobacteraceae bacterium]